MKNLTNKVQLIGHLGKDPEIHEIKGGSKVARFTLACKDVHKNTKGDKTESTYWFNVVSWNNMADLAEKYLHRGSKLAIEGKLVSRNYVDKTGQKRYVVEVVMNEMMMLAKKAS